MGAKSKKKSVFDYLTNIDFFYTFLKFSIIPKKMQKKWKMENEKTAWNSGK